MLMLYWLYKMVKEVIGSDNFFIETAESNNFFNITIKIGDTPLKIGAVANKNAIIDDRLVVFTAIADDSIDEVELAKLIDKLEDKIVKGEIK